MELLNASPVQHRFDWPGHFVPFEGRVNHLYLDTEGFVTVGIGCRITNPLTLPMGKKTPGSLPPTAAELQMEYNTIKALEAGHPASFYDEHCKLIMPEENIDDIFNDRLTTLLLQLETKLSTPLETYPDAAVLVLADMAFNLGVHGLTTKFPQFMRWMRDKNWAMSSQECHRQGVSEERNQWTERSLKDLALA